MHTVDSAVFDADNHYYEALDAFTRHLDPADGPRVIQWVDVGGRKYHAIGGRVCRAVTNPTFDPVSPAGSLMDYFRGNPNGRSPLELLGTPEPIRPEYRDRDARLEVMDAQGLEKIWLFPTLGMVYENLLKHDPDGVMLMFRAFNRWLVEDWGMVPEPDLRRPVHLAGQRRRSRGRARMGPRPRSALGRHAGGGPHDGRGPALAFRRDVRPLLGPGQRSGHHGRGPCRRRRPFLQRLRRRTASRRTSSRGVPPPNINMFAIERAAHDFLATLILERLFERFPNIRVASVENGSEFLAPLFRKLAGTTRKMTGYFSEDPDRHLPPPHLDQPVLGRRRQRDRRLHGRRPRDLRFGLAPH